MRNLLILAKWLAGRVDIDVVEYTGTTACICLIDGRRVINIPEHWSYSADPDAAELLEGVIDHEALGHGRFTDLNARMNAEAAGLIKFSNVSAGIQNILEDIYIENRAIATYPGVKANLARTIEILEKRGFFGSPERFSNSAKAPLLMAGLLNILRAKLVPGQDVALKENVEALETILPLTFGKLWSDVLNIAKEVQTSTSTVDNISLTIRIMQVIEDAAKQAVNEKANGQEQADECSKEGSADNGGEIDRDSQVEAQGSSDSTGQDSTDTQFEDVLAGDAGNSANAVSSEHQSDASQGKMSDVQVQRQYSKTEIEAAKSIIDSKDQMMPTTEIGECISEEIQKSVQSAIVNHLPESKYKTSVSEKSLQIASQIMSVSDDLQDALLAETLCKKSTNLVGKSLSCRVLSRVRLGNSRVFRQKREGAGLSTAVQFVVDMSGSMSDHLSDGITRRDAAIGLVYGMGDILDEYDVPFQINAYSDLYATLKNFGDDWTQVRKRKERPGISGGTLTGLAVQQAMTDLVVRQEDRKLLIVITDGDTGDQDVLMSCYSEAKYQGIEIASVMIGPKILSIEALAYKFGFKATSIDCSRGIGRFAVERVLEAI